MKHLPLPCPFANCEPDVVDFGRAGRSNAFSRSLDQVIVHLEKDHADLIGHKLDRCSKMLLPSWEPCPPPRPLPVPPPLPPSNNIPPGSLFVGEITVLPTTRLTRLISSSGTSLPVSHTPKPPRRRKMLQGPNPHEPSSPDRNGSNFRYEFADLPEIEYNPETDSMMPADMDFFIQHVGEGLPQRRDLVRPPPMPVVPMMERPPPPTSIFYDALRKQVMIQYARGEGAATDSMLNVV
ncbi:hypothetical protein DFH09DRAFT_69749 [Mycena vulgaris]|nr:hypothetical protein DFH09DRAFT_69749 [Mycena vulgaris]